MVERSNFIRQARIDRENGDFGARPLPNTNPENLAYKVLPQGGQHELMSDETKRPETHLTHMAGKSAAHMVKLAAERGVNIKEK